MGLYTDLRAVWADDTKTKREKVTAKVALIHAATTLPRLPWAFDNGDVSVTVTKLLAHPGGWELSYEATAGGRSIKDPRCLIINPPALVDDPAGDVVLVSFDPATSPKELIDLRESMGLPVDKRIERRLREDPLAAIRLTVLDEIRIRVASR